MKRILAGVVGSRYSKKRAPAVRHLGAVACSALFALVWLPDARAQEALSQTTAAPKVAQSFDELLGVLKAGQTVVVSDKSGKETKGKVDELTPSSLVVLGPDRQTFIQSDVAKIVRTDSVWNGALIGAGIGAAAALTGYSSAYGANSDAVYTWLYVNSWLFPTAGAVVGALVDKHSGSKPVYLSTENDAGEPGQNAQSEDFAQPSSRQEPQWLNPVPKAGTPVRVTERSGKSTAGRLVGVLPSAVRLVSDGVTLEVPLADVALVQRNGDSLWNGVAWGAGIASAISLGYNGDCDSCYSAGELAANRLALAGIGAGVGALVDLLMRDKRILYRAPNTASASRRLDIQPILTGDSRGLRLSLGW